MVFHCETTQQSNQGQAESKQARKHTRSTPLMFQQSTAPSFPLFPCKNRHVGTAINILIGSNLLYKSFHRSIFGSNDSPKKKERKPEDSKKARLVACIAFVTFAARTEHLCFGRICLANTMSSAVPSLVFVCEVPFALANRKKQGIIVGLRILTCKQENRGSWPSNITFCRKHCCPTGPMNCKHCNQTTCCNNSNPGAKAGTGP